MYTQPVVTSLLWAVAWNPISVTKTLNCPVSLEVNGPQHQHRGFIAKCQLQDQNLNHLIFFSEKNKRKYLSCPFRVHLDSSRTLVLLHLLEQRVPAKYTKVSSSQQHKLGPGVTITSEQEPDDKPSDHTDSGFLWGLRTMRVHTLKTAALGLQRLPVPPSNLVLQRGIQVPLEKLIACFLSFLFINVCSHFKVVWALVINFSFTLHCNN